MLDGPVEEFVFHFNHNALNFYLGCFHQLPVHLVVGGGLHNEVNGHICNVHVACSEGDEVECVELSVDVHVDVHAAHSYMNLFRSGNLFEDLLSEAGDCIEVDLVELKLVECRLFLKMGFESLVVKRVVAEDWDESLKHVVHRCSVQVSTERPRGRLAVFRMMERGRHLNGGHFA